MKIVFRADASARIGAGHVMRCLTLAQVLQERGAQVLFVCREQVGNLVASLRQKAMRVSVLPASVAAGGNAGEEYTASLGVSQAEDAEQTIEVLRGNEPDWLVVDHYGLGVDWERRSRPHAGRLLVVDDLAKRHHDCDALLDQNYSMESDGRYAGLVPAACKMFLGPEYALIREEFRTLRDRLRPRSGDLTRILVFFTAGDDHGEALKAMEGIEIYGKAEQVDVVVGYANSSNAKIAEKCKSLGWGYHCQVDYMASLIAQADLVIGGSGSSNWERCALGAPALVTILSADQAPIAQALDRVGVVSNLGWGHTLKAADYASALAALTRSRLTAMSRQALLLVDARGAEKIADVLYATQSEESPHVS